MKRIRLNENETQDLSAAAALKLRGFRLVGSRQASDDSGHRITVFNLIPPDGMDFDTELQKYLDKDPDTCFAARLFADEREALVAFIRHQLSQSKEDNRK